MNAAETLALAARQYKAEQTGASPSLPLPEPDERQGDMDARVQQAKAQRAGA